MKFIKSSQILNDILDEQKEKRKKRKTGATISFLLSSIMMKKKMNMNEKSHEWKGRLDDACWINYTFYSKNKKNCAYLLIHRATILFYMRKCVYGVFFSLLFISIRSFQLKETHVCEVKFEIEQTQFPTPSSSLSHSRSRSLSHSLSLWFFSVILFCSNEREQKIYVYFITILL